MERVQMAETLEFSRIIQGFWRLAEWNMTKQNYFLSLKIVWIWELLLLIMLIFMAVIRVKDCSRGITTKAFLT